MAQLPKTTRILPPRASYSRFLSSNFSVDEWGCDKLVACRRNGWSPLGVTPIPISKFRRTLRKYTQEAVLLACTCVASTDPSSFDLSSDNSSSSAGAGQSQNLYLKWTTPLPIVQTESRSCFPMRQPCFCTCRHAPRTSTPSRNCAPG